MNETTENSQTALVLAAQRGHIKVVEELLNLKADFTVSDDSDRTVLHYAIEYPEILKLLLKVEYKSLLWCLPIRLSTVFNYHRFPVQYVFSQWT